MLHNFFDPFPLEIHHVTDASLQIRSSQPPILGIQRGKRERDWEFSFSPLHYHHNSLFFF